MSLQELKDRTAERLERAKANGEEDWIARLEKRLARYEARLEEKALESKAPEGQADILKEAAPVQTAPAADVAPEMAESNFMKYGFGPRGRPRREASGSAPQLHLPKRVKFDLRKQNKVAAEPETVQAEEKTDDAEFVFAALEADAAAEMTLSEESNKAMADFTARKALQRKTRRRQLFSPATGHSFV